MNADINALVDKLVADAEKKIRTDLVDISSRVKKDFVEKASEVVMMYYSNYQPKIYQRTYNLKENVINEEVSFSVLNGGSYGAWIRFDSDSMEEYEIGNKDAVVSNFMYGIHGRRNIFVEKNSAKSLMDDFQMNYKKILDGYFIGLGYSVM